MHFLITAGGTREYIDPVRFISNESSGKMGYALAQTASRSGHKVTLISAACMQPPIGVDFVGVDSAKEMFEAVKKLFKKCDCLIMAAAVSDYTPVRPLKTKIKKDRSELILKLKPTKDILAWAGKNKKKNQLVVGFALEDKNLRQNAEKKLKQKNLDMIVANTPTAIAADQSTVHIKIAGKKWFKTENKDKTTIAKKIITLVKNI
ncbi:MAG: phosphopantothenoylcysteine decarboxylase domain-containing protein [Planctomycetota bacterium]|jgi:phosphopantothenoylcysteine synthetase/decarboxylase